MTDFSSSMRLSCSASCNMSNVTCDSYAEASNSLRCLSSSLRRAICRRTVDHKVRIYTLTFCNEGRTFIRTDINDTRVLLQLVNPASSLRNFTCLRACAQSWLNIVACVVDEQVNYLPIEGRSPLRQPGQSYALLPTVTVRCQ